MDESRTHVHASDPGQFTASIRQHVSVFSFRYMDNRAEFIARIEQCVGCNLPQPLTARTLLLAGANTPGVLVWRSPTESLLLTPDSTVAERVNALQPSADGCVVDLSGSLSIVQCTGHRLHDVLARLGGSGILPSVGEAKRGRWADVPALALCLREGDCQILTEYYYAPHLLEWARQAAASVFC
jgi:hypothetical protein